jgi:hypothetical protein
LREAVLSAHAAWLAERCRRHVGSAEVMGQALQCELGLTVSLRTVERACAPRVGRGSAGDGAL